MWNVSYLNLLTQVSSTQVNFLQSLCNIVSSICIFFSFWNFCFSHESFFQNVYIFPHVSIWFFFFFPLWLNMFFHLIFQGTNSSIYSANSLSLHLFNFKLKESYVLVSKTNYSWVLYLDLFICYSASFKSTYKRSSSISLVIYSDISIYSAVWLISF